MKNFVFCIIFVIGIIFSAYSQGGSDVVSLTKTDFLAKVYNYEKNADKWVYEGDKPCIIDFYADWCGPCKKLAPVLAEVATEYKSQINVYKIDTDKERELAKAFRISGIPTVLFIPMDGGPQVARGALTKEEVEAAINQFLLK